LHSRPLLVLLALEPSLNGLARNLAALEARSLAAQVQCLPAAVELDHGSEYRTGLGRQRFQLRDDGIGFGVLLLALPDRVEPLPREPGDAVVLVLCRIGEPAQSVGCLHALRRRHARLRLPGEQGQFDQRGFIAYARDRGAAALRVLRAARHFDPDRIGAPVRGKQRLRERAVLRLRKCFAQRGRKRKPHAGIGFGFRGRSERRQIGAALRGGDTHLRRRIGEQQSREFARIRRQRRNAEDALRRFGVLMQGGA